MWKTWSWLLENCRSILWVGQFDINHFRTFTWNRYLKHKPIKCSFRIFTERWAFFGVCASFIWIHKIFLVTEINCTLVYKVIDADSSTILQLNLSNMKTASGTIILAENIFTIEKILFPLSRHLMKIRRQKIILMVTNTTDAEFDAQANDILTKFFQRVRIINIILITPCSDGPKVC